MVIGLKTLAIFLLVLEGVNASVLSFECRVFQDSPTVERAIRPAYPAVAAARRISGKVLIDVEVDPGGSVQKATVTKGPSLLRQAAKEAAMRWVFNVSKSSTGTRTAQLVFIFHPISYVPKEDEPDFKRPYQMSVRWEGTGGTTH